MPQKEKQNATGDSFESRLLRLEELAESIRSGKVSLEDATQQFEEGMKLAQSLEQDLSKIERKVEILVKGDNGNGKPILELFPEITDKTEN